MLYKVSVIRRIKHASTATCTLPIYMGFLMTEPNSISCTQLAETYNISHDSVNRFLEREDYTPHDLYQEAIQHIDNNKLIVSIDDTVLDKPYSQHMDLVSYFWSGKHHRSVKGINLITLYATDQNGQNIPINFRIYDKSESKTKKKEQERKDDTRRKILLGSYLIKKMQNEANKEKILAELNEYLTEDRDRKLFNL